MQLKNPLSVGKISKGICVLISVMLGKSRCKYNTWNESWFKL